LEAALAWASAEPSLARARALNNLGNVYLDMGEPGAAVVRYEASLAMRRTLDDREGMADTLNNLGLVALAQGDIATARARHEESLAIRRELGDPWGIALSVSNLGDVANNDGDYDTAQKLHQEALDIRRRLGEPRAIGYSLNNLGESALGKNDLPRAEELFRAARDHLHQVGDRSGESLVLHNLGLTALRRHNYGDSVHALASAYRLRVEIQERQGIADTVTLLSQLATSAGESKLATELQATVQQGDEPPQPRAADQGELVEQLTNTITSGRPPAAPALAIVPDPMKDLTPREREVIRLVAEGRSDREIGEELFITTRTASTHVTNILGKLALPSRTAAAAWVLRHDAR
jgi:DNA-binding CsgD family transcriptional regulator/tetratricopeptide (TPR) repeat protein